MQGTSTISHLYATNRPLFTTHCIPRGINRGARARRQAGRLSIPVQGSTFDAPPPLDYATILSIPSAFLPPVVLFFPSLTTRLLPRASFTSSNTVTNIIAVSPDLHLPISRNRITKTSRSPGRLSSHRTPVERPHHGRFFTIAHSRNDMLRTAPHTQGREGFSSHHMTRNTFLYPERNKPNRE